MKLQNSETLKPRNLETLKLSLKPRNKNLESLKPWKLDSLKSQNLNLETQKLHLKPSNLETAEP
jgi:hypothetical protein